MLGMFFDNLARCIDDRDGTKAVETGNSIVAFFCKQLILRVQIEVSQGIYRTWLTSRRFRVTQRVVSSILDVSSVGKSDTFPGSRQHSPIMPALSIHLEQRILSLSRSSLGNVFSPAIVDSDSSGSTADGISHGTSSASFSSRSNC